MAGRQYGARLFQKLPMRTAITIANIRKTGETVLLLGENVPLDKQRLAFKEKLCVTAHPEYASAKIFSSSIGVVMFRKYRTPAEQAAQDAHSVAFHEEREKLVTEETPEMPPAPPAEDEAAKRGPGRPRKNP